jgi:hypothetical protein
LDDQDSWSTKISQQRVPLIIALTAGIALGLWVMHGRGVHTAEQHKAQPANQVATPAIQEQPHSAANVNDSAAVGFNQPAQISHNGAGVAKLGGSTGIVWNASSSANAPAMVGQSGPQGNITALSCTPANAQATVVPSDVQGNDPSRAAWLQGTIHSPSVPIQR